MVLIILSGYVGAFWNSTGSAGFPAQTIKTLIAPGSAATDDTNSDLYRMAETYNLVYTIRLTPLLGLGLGATLSPHLAARSVFDLTGTCHTTPCSGFGSRRGLLGSMDDWFYLFARAGSTERQGLAPL